MSKYFSDALANELKVFLYLDLTFHVCLLHFSLDIYLCAWILCVFINGNLNLSVILINLGGLYITFTKINSWPNNFE